MKKKIFKLYVIVGLIILVIGGFIMYIVSNHSLDKNGILVINDKVTITRSVTIHTKKGKTYADLPLIEVLLGIGMSVDWVDDNIAYITYKDKKYVMNLAEASIIENGKSFNLISPPPGGKRSCKVIDRELLLDSDTFQSFIYLIGETISICFSQNESVIHLYLPAGRQPVHDQRKRKQPHNAIRI